jgi:hypothetical protein
MPRRRALISRGEVWARLSFAVNHVRQSCLRCLGNNPSHEASAAAQTQSRRFFFPANVKAKGEQLKTTSAVKNAAVEKPGRARRVAS